MHNLLRRQLRKHFAAEPPAALDGFLATVGDAYQAADDDRLLLERALDLSSDELLRANAESRALVAAIPDALVRISPDGLVAEVRGGLVPGFCASRRDCAGRRVHDLFPADASSAIMEAVERATRTQAVAVAADVSINTPTGEPAHLEFRVVPALPDQLIMIVRDVTADRVAAESERGRIERLAAQHEAMYRLATSADSEGPRLDEICRVASETVRVARASVWLFVDGEAAIECAALHADGTTRPPGARLSATAYPRYFAALAESRVVAAHEAATDPRTSEFADAYLPSLGIGAMLDVPIRQHGALRGVVCLEHVGGVRTWAPDEESFAASIAELVAMRLASAEQRALERQLQQSQKLEAVGLLAGGIAHDFNNLLTVVIGYAEVIQMQVERASTLYDDVNEIRLAAERASALTKQLLALSRGSKGSTKVVSPTAVVRAMTPMLRRIVGGRVELETHVDTTAGVEIDPSKLEQVILNLVVNARDATVGRGRVIVHVDEIDAPPSVVRRAGDTASPARAARLRVTDEGVGMPAEVLARVFEPFFTTKEPGKGTGLGMPTAFNIVREAGGSMTVDSAVGIGTSVCVVLPATDARVERVTPSSAPPEAVGGAGIVLIVEDEEPIRRLSADALRRAGYDVHAAADGASALARVRDGLRPDLIVTDVVMPAMSGPELYAAVQSFAPDVPVLFVSGNTQGISLDFPGARAEFLQKPFATSALIARVRELIR